MDRLHLRWRARPAQGTLAFMQDQYPDALEFRHVPEACQAPVRDWFAGRLAAAKIDGTRSIHLPHPDGGGRMLKLKGAGLVGGPVQFGVYHRTGPKAPVFDFDGRMMEDVAAGHDGAFSGGASFQQAATEYHVTQRLTELGYAVVPCLGYGRVEKDGRVSWFSLFDHEPGLSGDMIYPEIPLDLWIALNREIGDLMFELAVMHDLIGYCWYSQTPDGRRLIRDVHPYRFADPYNMSQVSWVMQLFYAMHIRGNAQRLRALEWKDPRMPGDLHVWQYRAFCPDVRLEDHDELRQDLVAPYMLAPPPDFSFDRLVSLLKRNRITAALMEACPATFARV
ncbi:MAG: hypothetical protein ACREH4_05070 [Vitreimonas sp.]